MAKPTNIDPIQVEQLASRFWKNTEIAAFFGCSESTIRHKFATFLEKGREHGKGKLRDAQLAAAFKGSAAMLIWLGKQYLSQTEKIEVDQTDYLRGEIEIIEASGNGRGREEALGRYRAFVN